MKIRTSLLLAWIASLGLLVGCGMPPELTDPTSSTGTPSTSEDAEYKEAVPSTISLEMKVPQQPSNSTTSKKTAEFYLATYKTSRSINDGVRHHLDTIENLVSHRPSVRLANKRVWGPHTPALAPFTYRFAVERKGLGRYSYLLQAKRKGANDSTYANVFAGQIQRGLLPRRGVGEFVIDFDKARQLDPVVKETGQVHVQFDTRNSEIKLKVNFKGATSSKGEVTDAVYHYYLNAKGQGDMKFAHKVDIDNGKAGRTAQEVGAIHSRWEASGAGRANVTFAGGDLGTQKVLLTECWDNLFFRTYYNDNKNIKPQEGQATSCVYP